jgi:hypothetical protein
MSATSDVTIRLARPGDTAALHALAALDSSPRPSHPVLLAESGERVRAALSLDDGRAIADPFHPTADLLALLRMRAASLETSRRPPRRGLPLRVSALFAGHRTAPALAQRR